MKTFVSGLIGAIIGAALSGFIAYKIFQKQVIINQNISFVDEVDTAWISAQLLESKDMDAAEKKKLKNELDLSLNKAWAKAFVTLPDSIFFEIDKTLSKGEMGKQQRNRIYHILRKKLYPKTEVQYEKIKDKFISIESVRRKNGI